MRRFAALLVGSLVWWTSSGGLAAAQQTDAVADQLGLTHERGSLPVWTRPDTQAASQLGQTVRDLEPAVLIVGSPGRGHGTAFVISRRYRLLATNAHVADLLQQSGSLTAAVNGQPGRYEVQRVWYHPGVVRYLGDSQTMVARSQDPQDGPVCPLGPDVAVLQLSEEGDVLPREFVLATPDELADLFAQSIGMLGFPGHDSQFPEEGQLPAATYHQGVVSRMTDFQGRNTGDAQTRQLLQHTASSWGGFSGSPIFLANGHVVGLHNMGRGVQDDVSSQRISHGVRIDCLWELLVYHRLDRMLPVPVAAGSLDVERFDQPDPQWDKFQRAYQLVSEAESLRQRSQFTEAVEKCRQAKDLAPQYPLIDASLLLIHTDYAVAYRERISPAVFAEQLNYALNHAKAYVQKVPSDPRALIRFAHAYANFAAAQFGVTKDEAQARRQRGEAIAVLTKVLETEGLGDAVRAEAYNYRGYSRMSLRDFDNALADYQQAIRLDPGTADYWENRADLFEILGRRNEAAADRRQVAQLQQDRDSEPAPGGSAAPTRYATWHEFVSREGQFRIEFPVAPKHEVQDRNGTPHHMYTYTDMKSEIQFLAGYMVLPIQEALKQVSAEQLLDAIRDSIVDDQTKLARETKIRLGDYPGREMELHFSGEGVMRMRQYLAGDRIYQLSVTARARQHQAQAANIRRFFDSFAVGSQRPTAPPNSAAPDQPPPDQPPPAGDWKQFASREGRFEALFPVDPAVQANQGDVFVHHLSFVYAEAAQMTLWIEYVDFTADLQENFPTEAKRLELIRERTVSEGRIRVEKPIQLSGRSGLELHVDQGEDQRLARLVVDGRRVYACVVDGPAASLRDNQQDVQRFLTSFRLSGEPSKPAPADIPAAPPAQPPLVQPPLVQPPLVQPPLVQSPGASSENPSPAEPAQSGWRTVTSYAGGFRVLFPGQPEKLSKEGEDYTYQGLMFVDDERRLGFFANYADFPETLLAKLATADQRLDYARDKLLKDGCRLGPERKLQLAGHRGRDVEIRREDGDVMWVRLFMVEHRMYQVGAAGRLKLDDPDLRRFVDSFALIPVVTDAGALKFEDVQACLGPLGPARESLEVLPFDPLDFRAKLSGLLTDPEGRVDMEWKLTVTDAGGETLLERSGRSRDPLGAHATSFPFFATVSLPDRPGRYKLTVAVEDHLSNQQTSFQRELIAKPLEFALVALRFFYDEAGHAPAPPGGVAGQVLYVQLKAVGFDRSAGQAEVAMTMQVFDEQGKPVLPKSITAEVSETSAEALRQATSIDFSARLPLERAGNYRLRITLHDRTGGQFVKQDVPLKVTAP